jgi:hypothetical protein
MKMRASNVAWLLPFFLSACLPFHKKQVIQDQGFAPPVANLPRPPAVHPVLPETALILPELPLEAMVMDDDTVPLPRRHHAPKPAQQQTANAAPEPDEDTGVSAIGTLSSGEPVDTHKETEDSLNASERGLQSLGRKLNSQDQKTAEQIREYIKQGREALLSGDVVGAHTLAAKAKILLNELIR